MAPEASVINPGSLTKFRKLRLQDVGLLDLLIQKTVEIALDKKLIKSKTIIVDATHTKARYNQKSPKEFLMEKSKNVRKAIYQIDVSMKEKFPAKTTSNEVKDQLAYCEEVISAIRKARQGKKDIGRNQRNIYYFDIKKCGICPLREGCYKEGAKSKTYSVTIKSREHKNQEAFQNSDEFKVKAKSRYKIEAKNSELKHRHGYDVATSAGLFGMQMQGAITIFSINLKRIIMLMKEEE